MNKRPRLLRPYPGAKNPLIYPVHDGGNYDCWLAPFAGSGEQEARIAAMYPDMPIVAADADFLVRVVWQCWGKRFLRKAVESLIESWQKRIALDPEGAFAELVYHANWYHDKAHQIEYNRVLVATVSILLRRLTFGGVVRFNSEGKFNVKLSQNKLKTFLAGWTFEWPEPPSKLKVFDDWSGAVAHMTDYKKAIAIIDPPYCDGTTDAYAQSGGDLDMVLDCVGSLLASGNVSRMVVFNYWGEWVEGDNAPTEYRICKSMQHLACEHRVDMKFSHLGILGSMNKGVDKSTTHRYEGVWEIGGRRMYGGRPLYKPSSVRTEQLSLVDL